MAIPDDKTRTIITLPDRLKSDFELLCNLDKRNTSKQFEYILEYYFKNVENRISQQEYDDYYINFYLKEKLAEKLISWFRRYTIRRNTDFPVKFNFDDFYQEFKNEKIDKDIVEIVMSSRRIPSEIIDNLLEFVEKLNDTKKD